jgi:hypothetical protein
MVLQRQMVDISLGLGLDTKSDSKQIIPGKLLTLENGVLRKNKQIRKRDGNRKLSNLTIDGTEITSGTSLATYKDELLLYANQNLYSYSDGASSFIDKGACVSAIVSTKQIIKNTATQVQADSAGANGLSIYAWEIPEAASGVAYTMNCQEHQYLLMCL